MKIGDVCTVEIDITQPWRARVWTLALIVKGESDPMNWTVDVVQVIGETHRRDAHEGRVMRIDTYLTQEAARRLVAKQAGKFVPYLSQDAVRQAITAEMALTDTD